MANFIQLKRSSVQGKKPEESDLQVGELAVNLYDGLLYSKNTTGNIIVVGSSTTSNITEGANLYFTDARVATAVSKQTLSNATFSGNVDANYFIGDGSLLTGLAPASQDYIFTSANSSISGYFVAKNLAAYDESNVFTVTKTVNTSPTLLATFATETGFPNITVIPSGRLSVRLETQKALGVAGYFVFAEIYKRTTSNVETLLVTTDNSSTSTLNSTIQQEVSAFISSPINSINVTDLLVVKLYAQTLTSSASISLRFDDLTNSGVTIPTLPASAVNFVPYNNATSNIDLGNYGITASFLNATTLTGNINVSNITNLTTNSVTEGNNLYFTNTRAVSAFTGGSGIVIAANGRITANVASGSQYFIGLVSEDTFTGNGIQTVFSLSSTANSNSEVFVFVNGVVQEPEVNYYVSGNTLTFISAPDNGANVFTRTISSTELNLDDVDLDNRFTTYLTHVAGNIIPAANATYTLGNTTHRFKDIFISGNSIDLDGIKLSSDGTNIIVPQLKIGSGANSTVLKVENNSLKLGNDQNIVSESSLTTANVSEVTNLYFTNTRARAAISVTGAATYDNTTGLINVTGGVTSVGGATGAVSNAQLITSVLPPQTGNTDYILKTTGTSPYWSVLPTSLSVFTRTGSQTIVSLANGFLPVTTRTGSTTNVTIS